MSYPSSRGLLELTSPDVEDCFINKPTYEVYWEDEVIITYADITWKIQSVAKIIDMRFKKTYIKRDKKAMMSLYTICRTN